eukprot:gene11996-13099_t
MFSTTPPSSYLLNSTPAPIPGPSLALAGNQPSIGPNLDLVGNQPSIVNEGVSAGGNVAVEGQITQILRGSVGVVQIRVQMIAGNVTDPLTLFGQAFEMSYAQALQADGKQVSNQDSMQVTLKHDGIRANGGWWGTPDMPIVGEPGALEEWVARWSEAMQSGEEVDLSQGAIEFVFTYTLMGTSTSSPIQKGMRMGARSAGSYQRNKKRMYVRSVHSQMYTQSLALRKVPMTEDEWCFPMAFLFAQCRRMVLNDEATEIIGVLETEGLQRVDSERLQRLPYRVIDVSDRRTPATYYQSETKYKMISRVMKSAIPVRNINENFEYGPDGKRKFPVILFNPLKTFVTVDGKREYKLEEWNSEQDILQWKSLAEMVHAHVELQLQHPVDRNDFYSCCQAYATVFQVHIHIFRCRYLLQESNCFYPSELLNPKQLDHVYLLFGDDEGNHEHCHSVTHRRHMARRPHMGTHCCGGPTHYCDFCHRYMRPTNTQEEVLTHINLCYQKTYALQRNRIQNDQTQSSIPRPPRLNLSTFRRMKNSELFMCTICSEKDIVDKKTHLCYVALPKLADIPTQQLDLYLQDPTIAANQLYVYDIETRQVKMDENLFIHECNCVCFRKVGFPEPRLYFDNMELFCEHILSSTDYYGATILAHNGGSFDHQFVVQYLERHSLPYEAVPRPGSVHKYIQIKIERNEEKASIYFKDFLMFFPASLKSIAESLQLELQKGDFPHLFNTRENETYVGSFPSIDSEHDYYCLKTKKDANEIESLRVWHREESEIYCTCNHTRVSAEDLVCPLCHKQWWNMKEQLVKYCWLDVDVLSQCVEKFRLAHLEFGNEEATEEGGGWKPTPIEPFQCMTLAQLALRFFQQGHLSTNMRHALSQRRFADPFSKKAIIWLERCARTQQREIWHAGNQFREYYDEVMQKRVDGYCPETDTVYEFLGCFWHGCPTCFANEMVQGSKHPKKNQTWKEVFEETDRMMRKHEWKRPGRIEWIWECDFDRLGRPTPYESKLCDLIQDRAFFFGGRTEVFSCYAKATESQKIHHIDVTSMYPYICATQMLPIGHPRIYLGSRIDRARMEINHPNRYFGYIRCDVLPNPTCALGLLPQISDNGKLEFNCFEKMGTWFSEELFFAVSQGYEIKEVYEVLHFDSNNRSDEYMRGYMSFFLRQKQEAEGWKKAGASSENPSPEEQEWVRQRLYQENGNLGKMRISQVRKNPVKRALAKLYLNCLWGKLAQDTQVSDKKLVFNYDDWMNGIINNPEIDRSSLKYRFLEDGETMMCYFDKHREKAKVNRRSNLWLAAAVTAHARVILHRQMVAVGPERVLYCDTDSIIFLQDRDRNVTDWTARGLGNWANETDEGNEIEAFYGIAPKCYMKVETDHQEGVMKCKGVRMTVSNQRQTKPSDLAKMLETTIMYPQPEPSSLMLDHMVICPNSNDTRAPYASVFTRYSKKRLRAVLTKRQVVPLPKEGLVLDQLERLYLAPYGPLKISENPTYNRVYERYA